MYKFNLTYVNLSINTMRLCASLLLILLSGTANAENIKPFTSDGCSSFPDGTIQHKKLWLACCTAHDYAYWQGGTYEERLKADKVLQQCVADVDEIHIANLMLAGVRIGGSPFIPTTFRWGYGWSYPRLYQALTADEVEQITALKTELTKAD